MKHLGFCLIAMLAPLGAGLAYAGPPAMPDPTLTPGAVRPGVTAEQLCDPQFHTGAIRNVPESEKRQVYAEYGMVPHEGACAPDGCEVDHLVSLEIGGSNDIKNLWPEPYAPAPNARQKDCLENRLHKLVCTGAIPLAQAQHEIATDWYAAYRQHVTACKESQ